MALRPTTRRATVTDIFYVAILVMVIVLAVGFAVVMYIQGKIFVAQNLVSSTLGEDCDNILRAILLHECEFSGQTMSLYQALSLVASSDAGRLPPGYEVPSFSELESCVDAGMDTISGGTYFFGYNFSVTNSTGHVLKYDGHEMKFLKDSSENGDEVHYTGEVVYESRYPLVTYGGKTYWVVFRKERVHTIPADTAD